jgi:hypothetical protein
MPFVEYPESITPHSFQPPIAKLVQKADFCQKWVPGMADPVIWDRGK